MDIFKIPSLDYRRLFLSLCSFYLIRNHLFYFPPTGFLPPAMNHTSSRNYNPCGYYLPRAHCNVLKFSILHTIISVWNNLPHHALTAESFSVYRRAIQCITAIYVVCSFVVLLFG